MTLDGDLGYLVRCDWCGKVMDFSHAPTCPAADNDSGPVKDCLCGARNYSDAEGWWFFRYEYWPSLFRTPDAGRRIKGLPADFPEDTCRECSVALSPIVQSFAEISLINYLNTKLGKAINERRKENR